MVTRSIRLPYAATRRLYIGERLFVSEETVKTHMAHILAKLALQNRTQLVAYAVKHGLLSLEDL